MATIKIRRGTTDPITLAPGGVTSGEPIFNTALNKLFVHNGTTGIWVGAEVDNGITLGSSQTKIPTQYAVKTYVDNNLASGAVTSINGVTGAASVRAGTGIGTGSGVGSDSGTTISTVPLVDTMLLPEVIVIVQSSWLSLLSSVGRVILAVTLLKVIERVRDILEISV